MILDSTTEPRRSRLVGVIPNSVSSLACDCVFLAAQFFAVVACGMFLTVIFAAVGAALDGQYLAFGADDSPY